MNIGVEWAWVIPVLSASAFVLVALFGRWLPMRGAFVSVAAILLGFVLFWLVLVDLLENGGGTFSAGWLVLGDVSITWGVIVDRLSVTMIGLVTFVALLVQVYSIEYMRGEPRYGWYFASHALFAAAMLTLVLADNLVFLYLAWELVGLGSYLLIGFWHEKRPAAEAAKKAFVTTRIGDVGLLIGIILLYRATGTFDISGVIHAVENGVGTGLISQGTVNLAMFLVFLGAMGKSAQFPFHVWLPDAMEGPTPVSALIHAATMVAAGVFLVARLMPLFEMAPAVLLFVAVIGLFTFAFAGTLALVMNDLKRVLAYSTISHLGLMMLSLGAFGMAVAILHLLIHGVSKALLFLGAGSVTHGTGRTDIREMGGLWRAMPITAVTFTIGAASLAGLVPFSGFFSKEEVLITVLDERGFAFFVPTFAAALLSALYMARVTFLVFFGASRSEGEAHESPWLMRAPLILLAPLALVLGGATYQVFGDFLAGKGAHASPWWLAGLSGGMVGAIIAISWMNYARRPSWLPGASRYADPKDPEVYPAAGWTAGLRSGTHRILVNKYYVDEAYQWAIDRVFLGLGRLVALFDRVIVNDTGVDGPALSVWLSAMRVRYIQSGLMYTYAMAMALGVVGLALLWWLAA